MLILTLVGLIAACDQTAETSSQPVVVPAATLAGLYEKQGVGGLPDRICLTGEASALRFGLVSAGKGPGRCTAKGLAVRDGAVLALRIDGAPACALRTATTTAGLSLEAAQGAECDYYCGGEAELTPGEFKKVGTSQADIRKVVDAAGEPLC